MARGKSMRDIKLWCQMNLNFICIKESVCSRWGESVNFLPFDGLHLVILTYIFWPNPRTPLHMDGGLDHFFPNSILLDIAKDGFTIIWRLSKNMNFHKIWRLWLKNCARHAHFNFELLKGVAASFFELCPSNFSQACIFYRQTNDVFTAKLYL